MSRRRKITIAVVVGMLAFCGVWAAWVYTLDQNNVGAYKKSLIAQGEKLEISEVLPTPVPPDENSAGAVNQAAALLPPPAADLSNTPPVMRMVAPGRALVGFEQPYVFSREFSNSWNNVLAAAAYNRPATEMLKQVLAHPSLDFHLDYSLGRDISLMHLAALRRCTQKLSVAAVCDLHNGNPASAATNICVLLALIQGEQDERLVVSQTTRAMLALFATQATWELLQSSNVNDAELAMVQKSWGQLEYLRAMENAFLMERATAEDNIEKMRDSNVYLKNVLNRGSTAGFYTGWTGRFVDTWEGAKRTYGELMWRVSWTYSDELRMLQNYQTILETVRTIETNDYFNPAYSNMVGQLTSVDTTNATSEMADYQWAFSQGSGRAAETLTRTLTAEIARHVVVAAIALKRYQLKYGSYPPDLKSLVPEFAEAVPRDPVDGQPLRYRLKPGGTFLLYSVGADGQDDGGDPTDPAFRALSAAGRGFGGGGFGFYSWINFRARDWVWPQPATADDIENFYARFKR